MTYAYVTKKTKPFFNDKIEKLNDTYNITTSSLADFYSVNNTDFHHRYKINIIIPNIIIWYTTIIKTIIFGEWIWLTIIINAQTFAVHSFIFILSLF